MKRIAHRCGFLVSSYHRSHCRAVAAVTAYTMDGISTQSKDKSMLFRCILAVKHGRYTFVRESGVLQLYVSPQQGVVVD